MGFKLRFGHKNTRNSIEGSGLIASVACSWLLLQAVFLASLLDLLLSALDRLWLLRAVWSPIVECRIVSLPWLCHPSFVEGAMFLGELCGSYNLSPLTRFTRKSWIPIETG